MTKTTRILQLLLATLVYSGDAFVVPQIATAATTSVPTMQMMDTFNSLLISTIDADIQAIPDNEFRSVFMGGIVVMLGGLLSAVIVGTILEKRDLYANVVAQSYAQGGQETFWKGLSEEEKTKAQDMIVKLRSSGNEGAAKELEQLLLTGESTASDDGAAASEESTKSAPPSPEKKEAQTTDSKQKVDMFSDYE